MNYKTLSEDNQRYDKDIIYSKILSEVDKLPKENAENIISNVETGKKTNIPIETCTGYNYNKWHFLFPPFDIFFTLCLSVDKTSLFIISFIRCLIIGLIIKMYYDYVELKDIWLTIYEGLIAYGIINLIILVIVMLKQQKYRKEIGITQIEDEGENVISL
jgi:hypothetical protein